MKCHYVHLLYKSESFVFSDSRIVVMEIGFCSLLIVSVDSENAAVIRNETLLKE